MKTKKINFANYSSFKIGSSFDVTVLEKGQHYHNLSHYYMIGACNNILIGNNPPPMLMLSKEFDFIELKNNTIKIGAATPSGKITSFCKKNNIANFEFLSHLPGKLGGLVKMNAGLKEYEIFNHLKTIETVESVIPRHEILYGYRYTNISQTIVAAEFELSYGFDEKKVAMFKKMRANQPATPSAGSCFKNPQGEYAGQLIEAVGLKGFMQGAMCFSQKHANFLVNTGDGKFEDALFLIKEAQKRVYENFGIHLELEIEILDQEYMSQKSSY